MAERDGTIVIDTQIDTDGIQAGSKEAEARIRNLPKHHPVTADRVVAVSILAKCLRMSR